MSATAPWPSVLGDRRNTAAAPRAGPARPRLRWTYRVREGIALSGPPVVDAEGRLYIGTGKALLALDGEGRELWSVAEASRVSAAAIDREGALVVAVRGRGLLRVSRDGRPSRLVERELEEPAPPAVGPDGSVYVAARGKLLVLGADGRTLWEAELDGAPRRPPLVLDDGSVWVKTQGSYASADDASECADAVAAWSRDGRRLETPRAAGGYQADGACWGSCGYGGDCAPLAGERGTVVVGLGREIHAGARRLSVAGSGPLALSPGGALYVGVADGLLALGLDGTVRWRARLGGAAGFPVVDGAGRVYCTGADGAVHALDGEGRPLWSWQPPSRIPGMAVDYALALGTGGSLFVAAWDALYALGEEE
jgi:outer membrane protein assembly factor BamB